MSKIFFVMFILLGLSAQAGSAIAQQTRAVKFDSRYNKLVKGAVCLLQINGQTLKITTPSRVDLPLNERKELSVESMKCDFRGLKRSTKFFPDQDNFGSKIYGVTVSFKSAKAVFRFKKQNGGVAFYTRGDKLITVSVPVR